MELNYIFFIVIGAVLVVLILLLLIKPGGGSANEPDIVDYLRALGTTPQTRDEIATQITKNTGKRFDFKNMNKDLDLLWERDYIQPGIRPIEAGGLAQRGAKHLDVFALTEKGLERTSWIRNRGAPHPTLSGLRKRILKNRRKK